MIKRAFAIGLTLGVVVLWLSDRASTTSKAARPAVVEPAVARSNAVATARPAIVGTEVLVGDIPVDMSTVIERTHFAFEPRDGRFVGGDAAYAVSVAGRQIEVAPERIDDTVRGAALALRTVAFGRQHGSAMEPGDFRRDVDGHLIASLGTAVSEHLRNTRAGAEQSWTIDDVPDGSGDLVVRITTAGQTFVASNRTGLHFVDAATGLGIVYSHAKWIEAGGVAHEVIAALDHDDIVLRVPGELVDNSAYPALLDPTISAEYGMDNPIYGPAPDVQFAPSVGHSAAFNNDFLVVWHDHRRDVGMYYDVYAAHVNAAGTVLDPVGFLVSSATDSRDHKYPQVVWSGDDQAYIVVFLSPGSSQLRRHGRDPERGDLNGPGPPGPSRDRVQRNKFLRGLGRRARRQPEYLWQRHKRHDRRAAAGL